MAQAEHDETTDAKVLDTTTEATEVETATGETPQVVEGAEAEGGEADDEVVVTIGGESPTPEEEEEHRAPEWVRELRKSNREKDRKLRELEQEIARAKGTGQQSAAVQVGEEPTLEGCDYDAEKFKREWRGWNDRKAEADRQEREKQQAAQKQAEAWQQTLQDYGKEKSELKVRDYDEAEDVVRNTLSVTQQGILLDAVDKGRRAVVVYALGKNPKKAQELAAIDNPIKFTAAIVKLETQLKVTPRKSAPPPERTVRSTVAGAAAVDNQLEKLRAEAAKSGDLSKVLKFKAQQRSGK